MIEILIVGGGSSGWITASILKKKLGGTVRIRLLEASSIPTLGVGEATVPSLVDVLKDLEIQEGDFLKKGNGSFKLGIKFVNWRSPTEGRHHFYYHPFGHMPKIGTFDISQYWLRRWQLGTQEPFAEACSMIPTLCEDNKAPKETGSKDFQGVVEYAYHIDAGLLGEFLREYSENLGVERLIGKVHSVELNEKGEIDHLKTEEHGNLSADLYIDCSGFRSILLKETLHEPFNSYRKSLFCDRAIAISLSREKEDTLLENFTTAHALKHGWAWNIPLQTRWGTGYVYSSAHTPTEAAESEFRKFLGPRAKKAAAQHIKIRTGRHRNAWVKNCVGVGLAGGFVEPLESSGLALIYSTAEALVPILEEDSIDPKKVERFNQYIGALYDIIRDFIIIHYCTTNRSDTEFWQDCQNKIHFSDDLKSKLKKWKERLPAEEEYNQWVTLNHFNVICILTGMGFIPKNCKPGFSQMSLKQIEPHFTRLKKRARNFSEHLPSHLEFLTQRISQ